MRVSGRERCYCAYSGWREQYKPILLFVTTPLVFSYCSRLALRGSADDKTRILTIALAEYVFMARSMFVINARDGEDSSYYTYRARFDRIGDSWMFHLPVKILDALKYFGL